MPAGSKPGERRGGRKKGTPNKTTNVPKRGHLARGRPGWRGRCWQKGLIGYLRRVADKEVKAFIGLLGRALPLQMTGEGGGPVQIIVDTGIQRKDGSSRSA